MSEGDVPFFLSLKQVMVLLRRSLAGLFRFLSGSPRDGANSARG